MGNEIGGKQSKTAGAKCNDINNMVESTSSNVNYINDPVSIQYNFAAVSEMGPPVRNKSTQTVTRPSVSNKKPVKSVGTQTFMTMDKISEILFNGMNIAECQSASIGTQTFESEVSETSTLPVLMDSALSPSDNQLPLIDEKSSPSENFSDPIDDYSSDHDEHKKDLDQCGESFDEESESVVDSDDEEEEKPKKVILSCNKSPQDQQKFIVFEESLVKCFKHCFKCNSECIVSLESTIGTFSQISVNCLKDSNHSFHWSTGPLHNRLPVFHLLITAGILASGLESGKVLRLFDSLQIKCITRREFSTLQSVYAIPAVFNVWDRERNLLLRQIKGTSRCVASDMRVDSPGHTGLFGSGSSMDVEKNVILDTQIIKVLQIAIAHLIMQALTKTE